MEKSKFEVGQQVICINDTSRSFIQRGDIFTIEFVDEDDTLQFKDVGWWYNAEDFTLLTPAAALLYKNLPTVK